MQNAITVENLAKNFQLPHERRDTLKENALHLFHPKKFETFKAIKNLSFEVKAGQFFGIVGKNGSGKSTLLKMLAGIYQPDHGTIKIAGSIAPFLELGIGFQPELSARDNIFVNGTLLGLTTKQIKSKFAEIVEFAEIGNFLDLKVKNFSSGMQARLAFSIAIQADADIYLCDEVLAVGDEAFQQKCLNIFRQWKQQGKTIILVSHNPAMIQELCDQAILLDHGTIEMHGSPEKVLNEYHRRLNAAKQKLPPPQLQDFSSSDLTISSVRFFDANGVEKDQFKTGEELIIRMFYNVQKPVQNPVFGLAIYSDSGAHLTGPNTKTSNYGIKRVEKNGYIDYIMRPNQLLGGRYHVSVSCFNADCTFPYDYQEQKYTFTVTKNRENQYGLIELPAFWRNNN